MGFRLAAYKGFRQTSVFPRRLRKKLMLRAHLAAAQRPEDITLAEESTKVAHVTFFVVIILITVVCIL